MAKILIVDDDQEMLGLFRTRLADGYEISETSNPEAALILALQQKPDCIILDLSMPKLTGFELCRTLSSLSATSLIPILVVSGKPSWMYKDFCLNLGAREYFEKPVDFISLRERVAEAVKQQHPERRAQRRALLGVMLKLKVMDETGNRQEFLTVTEDVSAEGFLCACSAELQSDGIVEVSMMGGGPERKVGRARVVRVERPGTLVRRYGFQFVEKPCNWILAENDS